MVWVWAVVSHKQGQDLGTPSPWNAVSNPIETWKVSHAGGLAGGGKRTFVNCQMMGSTRLALIRRVQCLQISGRLPV
jgi:hypothetical protein